MAYCETENSMPTIHKTEIREKGVRNIWGTSLNKYADHPTNDALPWRSFPLFVLHKITAASVMTRFLTIATIGMPSSVAV